MQALIKYINKNIFLKFKLGLKKAVYDYIVLGTFAVRLTSFFDIYNKARSY